MDFDDHAFQDNTYHFFDVIAEDGYILQQDPATCNPIYGCDDAIAIYGLQSSISDGNPDVAGNYAAAWLSVTKADGGSFDADSIQLRRRIITQLAFATIEGVKEDGTVVSTTFNNITDAATYTFGPEFSDLTQLRIYNGGGGDLAEYIFVDDIQLTEVCSTAADADGDGIADDVDICPFDPANDADGDGLCAASSCAKGVVDATLRTPSTIQVGDTMKVELTTSNNCDVSGPTWMQTHSCVANGELAAVISVERGGVETARFVTPVAANTSLADLILTDTSSSDWYQGTIDYDDASGATWPTEILTNDEGQYGAFTPAGPPTETQWFGKATSGTGALASRLPEDLDIGDFEASTHMLWRWRDSNDAIVASGFFRSVLNQSCGAAPPPPTDSDGDGVPDDVDVCPNFDDNVDNDGDGFPDGCDACPADIANDADGDGHCESSDNCPLDANANQSDVDGDLIGDVCDSDDDNDGVDDASDNCPFDANSDQSDTDGDGAGDVCDADQDGDGVLDVADACLGYVDAPVDSTGCAIAQYCPCDHGWKNHGAYVKCVSHTAEDFVDAGIITDAEKDATVSSAGQSTCGHKR